MQIPSWRPIDRLNAEWAGIAPSPASRRALDRLARAEATVAALDVGDLGELVAVLSGHGPRRGARPRVPADTAAAVLSAMLRSQRVDPLIPRALLQAILPGLVGVARRLAWGAGGEWADGGAFLADAVTTAWEVLVEWAGEDRPYALLDILSAVRGRMRRQVLRHAARMEATVGDATDAPITELVGAHSATTDLEELARAIDRHWGAGIAAPDAAVLYAHRVLGYSLSELSAMTARSRKYLSERRDRAVASLTASAP